MFTRTQRKTTTTTKEYKAFAGKKIPDGIAFPYKSFILIIYRK